MTQIDMNSYQAGFNDGLDCAVSNAIEFDYITEEQADDLLSEKVQGVSAPAPSQNHPAHQGALFMQAIDKLDELLVFAKDKEAYFLRAKEEVESERDGEYDYYEGAEEAYSVLAGVVLRMKGELLNG